LREKLSTVEKRLAALEIARIERESARGAAVEIIPWSE
jgi:hypothetical protein